MRPGTSGVLHMVRSSGGHSGGVRMKKLLKEGTTELDVLASILVELCEINDSLDKIREKLVVE